MPATFLRQAKAAELSVPGSAISGRSAAAVFEVDGVRVGRLEISAERNARRSSRLARVRHRRSFASTRHNGIQVTTIEQTLCDLAAVLDPGSLERALDDVLVRQLSTPGRMLAFQDCVEPARYIGRPALSVLLDDRAGDYQPPTTVLEAGLDRIFRHPDLPPSVAQAAFPWWPEAPFRVDRFVPAWRRIIEVDGRRWHAKFRDFERDKARDHLAQMHGYEITRFTFRRVVSHPTYARGVLLAINENVRAAA
jgi:hypothetical protein